MTTNTIKSHTYEKLPDGNAKASVTFDVVVPRSWLEHCASDDVFHSNYSGHWARGVEWDEKMGYLIFDKESPPDAAKSGMEPGRADALRVWAHLADTGVEMKLPIGWYRLDEAAAVRGYLRMAMLHGFNWINDSRCDGRWYDCAVQLALFNEVRYEG